MNDHNKHSLTEVAEQKPGILLKWFQRLRDLTQFSWITYLITVFIFVMPFALIILTLTEAQLNLRNKLLTILAILIAITVIYLAAIFFGSLISYTFAVIWRQIKVERDINNLHDKLEVEGREFFTALIRINFKYIDKYYLQTQVQANKSFYLSAAAAVVSLIMIIAGIIMLFCGKTEPAAVSIGSGALGEFISAIFFYLYNRTVSEMSNYHQKLVLTQNISLALRIADGIENVDKKLAAQTMLIECLSKDINMYLSQQFSKVLPEKPQI